MARTDTLGNFLTDVADAIRTKKGSEELIAAADFDTEIENLPSGGGIEAPFNDVNFYDYDGFRVYSYSASEFLTLEAMPANPEHDGLTAQGWNWNLEDAQDYVGDYGILDIGQHYVTDDNKIRVYVTLTEGLLSPYLGFGCGSDTVYIDWGDGSEIEEVPPSGYSLTRVNHNYEKPGDYIITYYSQNSRIGLMHVTGGSALLTANNNSASSQDASYRDAITKVELSLQANFNGTDAAFYNCHNLQTITMPIGIGTQLYSNAFRECSSLKCIVLSSTTFLSGTSGAFQNCYSLKVVTMKKISGSNKSITENSFNGCRSLMRITIPSGYTSIGNSCFYGCILLKKATLPTTLTYLGTAVFQTNTSMVSFVIPSTISKISANLFNGIYSCAYYDFSNHMAIPTLEKANAFAGITANCKIIVPDNLYEDWIAATNWSNFASNIVSKSDWDALQNA